MSYKSLFSKSLSAAPDRLHMAAHSHHLWPDAAFHGQMQAFDDAARLADDKWDHVFSDIYPAAQRHIARELKLPNPETLVFAPNTHNLIVTLFSGLEARPIKVLTTDGEFHSLTRQRQRWEESGRVTADIIPVHPAETFDARFLAAAKAGDYDIVFTSHVFFNSGHVFGGLTELARLSKPEGPWVVMDGYHGFMAVPTDLSAVADKVFYLAGGYKYAMAGEGVCFMHAPPGFAPRPEITGWYAAFGDLVAPPKGGVGYSRDGGRFLGATFDPSGLYRFNAVRDMLGREGLAVTAVSDHVGGLQTQLAAAIKNGDAGQLSSARQLNDVTVNRSARFLALEHEKAQAWKAALHEHNIITDVRGNVLRIGLGLYHDAADIQRLCDVAAGL
ncbi:MAG: aminotransferase class V-fold PLP-dependent enzyme [Hellea sp.]